MKFTTILLTLVLISTSVFSGGCILLAAGAGAGTVAYVRGDLESTLNANMDKSYNAALKAFEQLELVPTKKAKDELGAELVARTSSDKKITLTLKRQEQDLTKVSVRIGVFGDESMSRAIYQKITDNLK